MSIERIRLCADQSIRRGCGFGMLAITTTMFGLAGDPLLALRGGAIMVTIMWGVLLGKGLHAPRRDYRQTEAWLLLDRRIDSVPKNRIQDVVGRTLRDRYLWHAEISAFIAVFLWILAFGLSLFR
jgi:hypothetical protein